LRGRIIAANHSKGVDGAQPTSAPRKEVGITNRTRSVFGAAILLASFGALPERAEAHEKWFVGEAGGGLRWDLFLQPLPLALVGTVLLATLLGGLLWRVRGRGFLPGPEAFGRRMGGAAFSTGWCP
jgi:hypothetical protein